MPYRREMWVSGDVIPRYILHYHTNNWNVNHLSTALIAYLYSIKTVHSVKINMFSTCIQYIRPVYFIKSTVMCIHLVGIVDQYKPFRMAPTSDVRI